ncbi:hypothetical protein GQ53DRAFT_819928 [Thozetella sp. PMI_491]|nr:hypothetical protein GQ53DRAFT_819928 [Thozetella sp. PMI_491]
MALNGNGERVVATIFSCAAVAIAATLLRFWCTLTTKKGIHADDWVMLATLLLLLIAQSIIAWGIFTSGRAEDISEILAEYFSSPSPERTVELETYLESLVISYVFVTTALFSAKISICLMYRRMFPLPRYGLTAGILMLFALMSFIAGFVTQACACIPLDAFWHRTKPGKCLNFNLFYLVSGVVDIIIDAAILALPVWVLQTLHLPLRTKLLVTSIFLLGGFAIITNILRVYYSYQPNDQFVSLNETTIWLQIHITMTILCGSTPVYQPIRNGASRMMSKMRDHSRQSWHFLLGDSRPANLSNATSRGIISRDLGASKDATKGYGVEFEGPAGGPTGGHPVDNIKVNTPPLSDRDG